MSYFGLNKVTSNQQLDDAVRSPSIDDSAGFFDGAFTSIYTGLYSGLIAKPEQALWGIMDTVVSPIAREVNEQFDINDTSEQFIQEQRKNAEKQVRSLTPDRATTGTAGQVMFSLFDIGGEALTGALVGGPLGGAMLVGGVQGFSDYEKLRADGVDKNTAINKATGEGLFAGLGVLTPMTLGFKGGGILAESIGAQLTARGGTISSLAGTASRATPDIVYASGSNIAMGMAQRGFASQILKERGYNQLASQYDVYDKQAIAIDGVLGVAFGGLGRYINSRGENVPLPEFDTPHVDAALTANQQLHLEADLPPGIPINAMSLDGHLAAMNKAMNDLSQGNPVDIGSILDGAEFLVHRPRSLIDTSIREAVGIIDEGSSLSLAKNTELNELASQLLNRGERENLTSSIHDLNYRIDEKTSEINSLANTEPKVSGKQLSNARKNKLAELRRLDNELTHLKNELKVKQGAISDSLSGGRFYEAKAELSRRQLAEEQSDNALVNYYATPKPRNKAQILSDEVNKTESMITGKAENSDIDFKSAELALKNNPNLEIDFLDDSGNASKVKASDLYNEAVRQAEEAKHDASLFEVAVSCFLRG
ncbi:hypothetical protein [Providencia rettgeri]|uniref:hypothetical protein n=1 Tax=Providencia rettgeri TaxID=587 RepID=UPI001BA66DBD|nr:hypothetical protein [Providencia rettgeri]MBS0857959.1 hypothetical protein [Providencia rettgeri]MBS0871698.1 hypothetical protein [Providencia rettgeri]MBS0918844.1 hypothetical protein [Providencia rettgeri]MCB4815115.1 hypothetical protein [Providencia rettgeri]MCJ2287734.1 hypothetical protein [Providencia rettgeri]